MFRPVEVRCPRVRVGAERDGGYVILDRYFGEKAIIGYGVDKDVSFENQLTEKYGVPGWVFDHTITEVPLVGPMVSYVKEGITGTKETSELFFLKTHVDRYIGSDGDYMLKMDVEGCEWEVLESADLSRVTQLVIEFHNLENYPKTIIEKLLENFYLVHIHGNNCHNSPWFWIDRWRHIPRFLECTFVRKDLVELVGPSTESWPSALDVKNREDADEMAPLNFWESPDKPITFIAPDQEQRTVLKQFVCPEDEVIPEGPGKYPSRFILESGDIVPLYLVSQLKNAGQVKKGYVKVVRRGACRYEPRIENDDGEVEEAQTDLVIYSII